MHIFRHLAQKFLDIRQYACGISIQSDEKSVGASPAQALCGIALKTSSDREREDELFVEWLSELPPEISANIKDLYDEMEEQHTLESKIYRALDKLEALIQHNESPLDTWSENEYELNRTYAFETVEFSDWLTELRKEILAETIEKTAHLK